MSGLAEGTLESAVVRVRVPSALLSFVLLERNFEFSQNLWKTMFVANAPQYLGYVFLR